MREILFRAKSKQTDRWITGYYFEDVDGKSYIGYMSKKRYILDTRDWDTAEYYENNPTYNWVFVKEEVVSETVGQYTGLIDRNGVKIFEGDIVRCVSRLDYANMIVIFEDGEFRMVKCENYKTYTTGNGYFSVRCFHKEVIGNIYDKPELVKD